MKPSVYCRYARLAWTALLYDTTDVLLWYVTLAWAAVPLLLQDTTSVFCKYATLAWSAVHHCHDPWQLLLQLPAPEGRKHCASKA